MVTRTRCAELWDCVLHLKSSESTPLGDVVKVGSMASREEPQHLPPHTLMLGMVKEHLPTGSTPRLNVKEKFRDVVLTAQFPLKARYNKTCGYVRP